MRGAQALLEEEREHQEAIERMIERWTGPNPPVDLEVLKNVKHLAWRDFS